MNWTRGRTIGYGSTAAVSLATCRLSGETFAVKSADVPLSEPLQNEARVLSALDSPHIVGYRGCDVTHERDGLVFNLFLEYVPAGSLSNSIRKQGGFKEATIARYARQILIGLDYLHSRGIVHCDVKPSNILIGHGDCAKITDFGCAKKVEVTTAAIGGTPMYMAPEAACGVEQGCPADIWAFGCTVVEMATGKVPWAGVCDPISAVHKIVYSGESPEIPRHLSARGKDFLEKCLRRNPKERWAAGQLLDHPFLDQIKSGINFEQAGELSCSPTSVMDQEFWDSVEVDGQATRRSTGTGESTHERFEKLCSGEELLLSWPNDAGWIDVRGGEEDMTMEECECGGDDGGSDIVATVGNCFEEGQEQADVLLGVVGSRKSLESVGKCWKSPGLVNVCDLLCFGRDRKDSNTRNSIFFF